MGDNLGNLRINGVQSQNKGSCVIFGSKEVIGSMFVYFSQITC
jgi:hypothetical protein